MSFEGIAAVIGAMERINTITFDGVIARLNTVETKLGEVKTEVGDIISGGGSQLAQLEVGLDHVIAKEATAAAGAAGLSHGAIPTSGFLEPAPGPRGQVGGNTNPNLAPPNIAPRLETTALRGSPGLFGDTFSPGQLNQAGRRFDPEGGGGNALAAQLADFATLIETVFGPGNFFASTIRSQIPYLTSGAKSPAEVRLFLQAAFIPFMAGIQNEIAQPDASQAMRSAGTELIRFIGGGNVRGGTSFPTLPVGPGRPSTPGAAAPPAAPPVTTAGIGAAVASAVQSQVTGLVATVTERGQQQADRVLAGVGQQAAAVTAAVNTRSAELKKIAEENVARTKEVADQFRESGRTLLQIDDRMRALGTNQLSAQAFHDELERLNLSGRLGVA